MNLQELQLEKLRKVLKSQFSTPKEKESARKSILIIINDKGGNKI